MVYQSIYCTAELLCIRKMKTLDITDWPRDITDEKLRHDIESAVSGFVYEECPDEILMTYRQYNLLAGRSWHDINPPEWDFITITGITKDDSVDRLLEIKIKKQLLVS